MSETEYDRTMRQAGKQVRDTADHAGNVASDLSQRVGGAAADAGAAVQDATRKMGSAAADAGQQIYHQSQRVGRGVIEQVENQPVTSVLVAAAAGFIAGILLARR